MKVKSTTLCTCVNEYTRQCWLISRLILKSHRLDINQQIVCNLINLKVQETFLSKRSFSISLNNTTVFERNSGRTTWAFCEHCEQLLPRPLVLNVSTKDMTRMDDNQKKSSKAINQKTQTKAFPWRRVWWTMGRGGGGRGVWAKWQIQGLFRLLLVGFGDGQLRVISCQKLKFNLEWLKIYSFEKSVNNYSNFILKVTNTEWRDYIIELLLWYRAESTYPLEYTSRFWPAIQNQWRVTETVMLRVQLPIIMN